VERFDAIVVGAGPAGSTTAYRLARAGASVLLLDRARFPRDKPCGGGLTARAVRALPFPVDSVVEDEVDLVELRLRYRRRFERAGHGPEPLLLMTQRRRLDAFLAEQAAAAGADFRDGTKAGAVEQDGQGVRVRIGGDTIAAQALVAADGVNGTTARALGLEQSFVFGVALEGNITAGARYRGRVVLEVGIIPGGYGWVFPKGDHVNVGVGGWEREAPSLRMHLRRLCTEHGLREESVTGLRGYRLPTRRADSALARGRALLVGDAAGLVDPLSGDGMYEAFVSGRLATEAVLGLLAGRTESVEPYAPALSRALEPMAAASWRAKAALDRFPGLTFAIARIPPVWGVLEQLLRGDLSVPGEARGPVRAPLRLLEALAR
jgi:geranylgeranyl reductase family protein